MLQAEQPKEQWIRGQAVVQEGIEGAIIMFNLKLIPL
jgi:hypothetical protein